MISFITKYPVESLSVFITILPIVTFLYRMAYLDVRLKFLFWMLVFKLVIDLAGLAMAIKSQNNLFLANAFVLCRYCFLARMFYEAFNGKRLKNINIAFSLLFLSVYILDFWAVGAYQSLRYSGTLECLLIMTMCCMYYYQLITELRIKNLLAFPFFWVCSSLLIYFAALTFITPLYYYTDRYPINQHLLLFNSLTYIFEIFYISAIGIGVLAGE